MRRTGIICWAEFCFLKQSCCCSPKRYINFNFISIIKADMAIRMLTFFFSVSQLLLGDRSVAKQCCQLVSVCPTSWCMSFMLLTRGVIWMPLLVEDIFFQLIVTFCCFLIFCSKLLLWKLFPAGVAQYIFM